MTHVFDVDLPDQIAEVRREIEQRKRVYVRMIDKGRLSKADAERQTIVMHAVLATLEKLRGLGNSTNQQGEPNDSRGGVTSETTADGS